MGSETEKMSVAQVEQVVEQCVKSYHSAKSAGNAKGIVAAADALAEVQDSHPWVPKASDGMRQSALRDRLYGVRVKIEGLVARAESGSATPALYLKIAELEQEATYLVKQVRAAERQAR